MCSLYLFLACLYIGLFFAAIGDLLTLVLLLFLSRAWHLLLIV